MRRILCLAVALLVGSSVNAALPPTELLAASDARYRYEGRFDFTDKAQPVVVWQDSRISIDFEGTDGALCFAKPEGQNYFDVELDDRVTVMSVNARNGQQKVDTGINDGTIALEPLDKTEDASWGIVWILLPGRHHLVITKRSEAAAGHVAFRGVKLAEGAKAWAPPAPDYRMRMEFIGDSITVGACNEDGATDQWETRRTHNAVLSYATLTGKAFGADVRNIAVSGMGIVIGYVPMKAGETWDRIYPRADSPAADLKSWQPDVVFVNLGENDDSFPKGHNLKFPGGAYTAGYVSLVRSIRAAYPRAQIVILRGGMFGGAQSAVLREAWEPAVKELEAGDPKISHFVFTHWSNNHPRVGDDRAMADELVAWLKQQPFMAPH